MSLYTFIRPSVEEMATVDRTATALHVIAAWSSENPTKASNCLLEDKKVLVNATKGACVVGKEPPLPACIADSQSTANSSSK